MALRSYYLSDLGPGTRTNKPNEAEPPRLSMTNGDQATEPVVLRNSSFAWLINSEPPDLLRVVRKCVGFL